MAEPNYQLLRYQAENIPLFNGNPKQINRFVTACENFVTAHGNRANNDAPINVCIFDTILSKLVGRAADLISSRIELNTWPLLKNAIVATFSDQRSIDCVAQDLITARPEKNESPLQFGIRLQDIRSVLFSKINNTNDVRAVKLLKIAEYEKLTLKTFINGLNYHMQLVVRLKNPDSLEQALTFTSEEENFILYKNRNTEYIKRFLIIQIILIIIMINKKSIHTSHNTPNTNFTPKNYSQQNYNAYYTPQFNPAPTFYRPPMQNNNPYQFLGYGKFRPNPQHFGNQNQNVGNQNNFGQRPNTPSFSGQARIQRPPFQQRPNFNAAHNQNNQYPEPMDTSSGHTIINKAQQQQQQK